MDGWSLVQLRFFELFFGELLLLEFAARVSLIFSDLLCCTRIKLGGWVKLGQTFFSNLLTSSHDRSLLHEFVCFVLFFVFVFILFCLFVCFLFCCCCCVFFLCVCVCVLFFGCTSSHKAQINRLYF